MYKFLVLCGLLGAAFAGPFGFEYWLPRSELIVRHHRGCGDPFSGWLACFLSNSSDALAPHPRDCRLFYYCAPRPACRRCPAGLHFSPLLHICDWPQSAGCEPSTPPTTVTTEAPTPNNSTQTTAALPSTNDAEDLSTAASSTGYVTEDASPSAASTSTGYVTEDVNTTGAAS